MGTWHLGLGLALWLGNVATAGSEPSATDAAAWEALATSPLTERALSRNNGRPEWAELEAELAKRTATSTRKSKGPSKKLTALRRTIVEGLTDADPDYALAIEGLREAVTHLKRLPDAHQMLSWHNANRTRGLLRWMDRSSQHDEAQTVTDARVTAQLAVEGWRRDVLSRNEAIARLVWATAVDPTAHREWALLAWLLSRTANKQLSLEAAYASLRTAPSRRERAEALGRLGYAQEVVGDWERALESFHTQRPLLVELKAEATHPGRKVHWSSQLAYTLRSMGRLYSDEGSTRTAHKWTKRALEETVALEALEGKKARTQRLQRSLHLALASELGRIATLAEAREALEAARAIATQLPEAKRRPSDEQALARIHERLGRSFAQQGEFGKAIRHYGTCEEMLAKLAEDDRDEVDDYWLASCAGSVGALHLRLGDAQAAQKALHRAFLGLRTVVLADPDRMTWTRRLAEVARRHGDALEALGYRDRVVERRDVANKIEEAQRKRDAEQPVVPDSLDWDAGLAQRRLGEAAPAPRAFYERAYGIFERIRTTDEENGDCIHELTTLARRLAHVDRTEGLDQAAAER
ncbi:MAG: hypothetical protein AAGA48_00005, partial [Myxococcota bacterium]